MSNMLEKFPGPLEQVQCLLDSYRHWIGRDLIDRAGSLEDQARWLFDAPFVMVAHGVEADPVLNFANRQALQLWEMDPETLSQTPSRMTAEPVHREERARLLERTTRDGYVDDYSGIRISATGKRFRIEQATVWNLRNPEGKYVGQAAMFTDWTPL